MLDIQDHASASNPGGVAQMLDYEDHPSESNPGGVSLIFKFYRKNNISSVKFCIFNCCISKI
jgi:hypothetical protein